MSDSQLRSELLRRNAAASVSVAGLFFVRCICLRLAQSGHQDRAEPCPLLGVKRTSVRSVSMSDSDPKRTFFGEYLSTKNRCWRERNKSIGFGFQSRFSRTVPPLNPKAFNIK